MIGEDVAECISCDLTLEIIAHPDLRVAISHCDEAKEYDSRDFAEGHSGERSGAHRLAGNPLAAHRTRRHPKLPAKPDGREIRLLSPIGSL